MNIAIILAAGNGCRLKSSTPKQFLIVNNKPVFLYSVMTFNSSNIDQIIIVIQKQFKSLTEEYIKKYNLTKVVRIVEGGSTRQASVMNALLAIHSFASVSDNILIHDSARPLITKQIICDNISALKKEEACLTAIPVEDTIISSKNHDYIETVLNRNELYKSQTPQSFKYDIILKAHEKALRENTMNATDDCQLVQKIGIKCAIISGDKLNFKITTNDDLQYFEYLLKKGADE